MSPRPTGPAWHMLFCQGHPACTWNSERLPGPGLHPPIASAQACGGVMTEDPGWGAHSRKGAP